MERVSATVVLSILSTGRQTSSVEVAAAILVDALPQLYHGFPQRWALLFHLLASGFVSAFAVRLAMAASMLVHEWAHVVLAAAVRISQPGSCPLRLRDTFSPQNCLGQTPLSTWLRVLLPFSLLPDSFNPHVTLTTAHGHPRPCCQEAQGEVASSRRNNGDGCLPQGSLGTELNLWQESIIRLGGWALSVILFFWSWRLAVRFKAYHHHLPSDERLEFSPSPDFSTFGGPGAPVWPLHALQCACLGSLLAVIGSTATDLLGFHHLPGIRAAEHKTRFFCGNFGMLVISAVEDAR